jgi:pilus assembly protein FimV
MINVRSRLHGLRLFLALVAGIMAAPAGAVGIGQAKVESFLGEPLRVRVAISFAPGENITGACVRIASPPGQESPFIPDLAKASFQLIEGPRGAELMITTRRPYTDPILVFPLKVGCGAGGVYREITLLIDPPGMAAPTRAARAKPAPAPTPPKPRSSTRPSQAMAPVSVEGGQWYVDRGETLTGIIVKSGLDGGDRKRRLELIDEVVAANPNVFRGRGPDYLPAGATLTLPGWGGSKSRGELPVAAAEPEPAKEAEPVAPPAPEPPPAAEQEEDFRLKLSGEQPEGVIVTPEMKRLEEELAKLNAASEEERQVNQDLQDRLLQLKQQAAELQLVAEQMARDSQELAKQHGEAGADASSEPKEGTPAVAAPTPETMVKVEAPAAVPPPPPMPQPEPAAPASVNDWINDNLVMIAAAVFVALLLIAFMLRGGPRGREGPTLDELIAQKELEHDAQVREVRETADAAHEDMLADIEADIADRDAADEEESESVTEEVLEELVPEADSTHYIFSVEEVDSLLEQAEVLLLFGEPSKAIMMIEEYLDGPGKESKEPRPWLKLFQLLRSEGLQTEFNERAHTFKRWFNIEKPNWQTYSPDGFESTGAGLEEATPHILRRIEELWNEPGEAYAYLDALLLDDRDGERVGFPAMIAEDMLILRDVARERGKAA